MWLGDGSISISNIALAFIQDVVSPGEKVDKLVEFRGAFPSSQWLKSPETTIAVSGYAFSCLLIVLCSSLSALSSLAHRELQNLHQPKSLFAFSFQALMNNNSIPQKEIMAGINRDEGSTFLVGTVPGMGRKGQSLITRKEFLYGVEMLMKDEDNCTKQMAIKMYTDRTDVNNGKKNRDALNAMTTDKLFICPLERLASR